MDTKDLVEGICRIRSEFKLEKSSLKILLHDSSGGLCGSAVFLSLHEILQKVDESFTEENQLKKSAEAIDVFNIVNNLRKDRPSMIDTYEAYKMVFLCLGYYGLNRTSLKQKYSKNLYVKPPTMVDRGASKVVVKRKNQTGQNSSKNTTNRNG